ncbi:MAG: nucleotidyltransferase substrate binding protein [Candidatus Magasanikbacteria bacterium]|nr:nucleotidyltransferase substrate binding protein [Candidatus Magasanikbacteria bacterium]
MIKRFEYTFELAWKSVKILLREKYGVDAFAPKECFRELRKNKMISDATAEKLLKMTDASNEIIHTYNEQLSNELYNKIAKQYRRLLEDVYGVLKE